MSTSIINLLAANPWLMAVLGGAVVLLYVAVFALMVLLIIGEWKIFKKANRPGWHSLIPILREYDLYGMCWNSGKYWQFLILSFAGGIASYLVEGLESPVAVLVLSLIAIVLNVLCIIIEVKMNLKLAKVFGKGTGCGIGLYLLPGIFTLVLGLGNAQYDESKRE